MLTSVIAAIAIQPAGIFPLAYEKMRKDGIDIVLVKDSKDKGVLLGQGQFVTQIPRDGGAIFVDHSSDNVRLLGFDSSGKRILSELRPGVKSIGRPAVDPSSNFVIAEFVGEEESEIWRIPLKGKGPSTMLSVINKGNGRANPAFEMSGSVWLNMGGTWMTYNLSTALTSKVDVEPLMDGLPFGSMVDEIRPSPTFPKLVAVAITLPSVNRQRIVMVWDRQTGLVSRVSPPDAYCDSVDWSRDGRYVLFRAAERDTDRITLQAVSPTGGTAIEIAVIRDART